MRPDIKTIYNKDEDLRNSPIFTITLGERTLGDIKTEKLELIDSGEVIVGAWYARANTDLAYHYFHDYDEALVYLILEDRTALLKELDYKNSILDSLSGSSIIVENAVIGMALSAGKVPAIKLYRELTKEGLHEAKRHVENLMENHGYEYVINSDTKNFYYQQKATPEAKKELEYHMDL